MFVYISPLGTRDWRHEYTVQTFNTIIIPKFPPSSFLGSKVITSSMGTNFLLLVHGMLHSQCFLRKGRVRMSQRLRNEGAWISNLMIPFHNTSTQLLGYSFSPPNSLTLQSYSTYGVDRHHGWEDSTHTVTVTEAVNNPFCLHFQTWNKGLETWIHSENIQHTFLT